MADLFTDSPEVKNEDFPAVAVADLADHASHVSADLSELVCELNEISCELSLGNSLHDFKLSRKPSATSFVDFTRLIFQRVVI